MKSLIWIAAFVLAVTTACGRCDSLPGLPHWPATGNREFDSLTVACIARVDSQESFRAVTDSMARVAALFPRDVLMRARVTFFRSGILAMDNRVAEDFDMLSAVMPSVDSGRYPHDFNLLKWHYSRHVADYAVRHRMLTECRADFESMGDSLSVGKILLDLANLYGRLSDRETALNTSLLADGYFRVKDGERYRVKNRVNIALFSPRDRAERLSLELLDEPLIRQDSDLYMNLLTNCFLFTDSLPLLLEARRLSGLLPDVDGARISRQNLFGDKMLRDGDVTAARRELRIALAMLDTATPMRFRYEVNRSAADLYHVMGVADSAEHYLRESIRWKDSVDSEYRRTEVMATDARIAIEREEMLAEVRLQRQRMWFIAVGAVLVILFLVALYLLHRRQARRHLRYVRTQSELRQVRYRMSANVAALENREQLIAEIKGLAREEGARSLPDKINRALKMHGTTSGEMNRLMITHDELNADFMRRLKRDFPTLVESQLRLAAYIASGMSNHMIAKLMSIEQTSVKKSRWRLRSKLGLRTGDSLEDFLRRYND